MITIAYILEEGTVSLKINDLPTIKLTQHNALVMERLFSAYKKQLDQYEIEYQNNLLNQELGE